MHTIGIVGFCTALNFFLSFSHLTNKEDALHYNIMLVKLSFYAIVSVPVALPFRTISFKFIYNRYSTVESISCTLTVSSTRILHVTGILIAPTSVVKI